MFPQGSRPLELPPGEEREATFTVHTRAAGILEARLYPKDAFGADNYAALELPELRSLHVVVYSDQPDALRPALASDPRVIAEFRPTAAIQTGTRTSKAGLVILHRFPPAGARRRADVLWIDPPVDQPPVADQAARRSSRRAAVDSRSAPDARPARARCPDRARRRFSSPVPNDIRLAEVDKGPIMLASVSADGKNRTVVMGFDPFAGAMRYELATPLLLANVLRWVAPDVFRDVDVGTQSAGAVSMPLSQAKRTAVQVLTDSGVNLPFNVRDKAVSSSREKRRVCA